MAFDIHKLDGLVFEEGEVHLEDYQRFLIDQFLDSPEGKPIAQTYDDAGFWAAQLIFYGFAYEGVSLPKMKRADVEEVVTGLFPRKITIESKGDAQGTITELVAFWRFLKRAYQLSQAERIIRFLESIESQFPSMMMDPRRFGMAKSMMMGGLNAGYDMTSEEGRNAFFRDHNESMSFSPPVEIVELPLPNQKKVRQARKQKRKMVRASQRRNRRRK